MKCTETRLPGVLIPEPEVFEDPRGWFLESYHKEKFSEVGVRSDFVQDNHSKSTRHTLRGLHYQTNRPQAKLCRVIQGEVLDVAVDIRWGSPYHGEWVAVSLSAENRRQIYIPRGFAHGFVVLSDTAEFLYKCDDVYSPGDDRGILWNDPEIGIEWGVAHPLLSEKDANLPTLASALAADLPLFET